jgi:hypothetical protein
VYVTGADQHMIYHAFTQMELIPEWSRMALQRVGEVGGPRDESEELNELELSWLVESLQKACYYSPAFVPFPSSFLQWRD